MLICVDRNYKIKKPYSEAADTNETSKLGNQIRGSTGSRLKLDKENLLVLSLR